MSVTARRIAIVPWFLAVIAMAGCNAGPESGSDAGRLLAPGDASVPGSPPNRVSLDLGGAGLEVWPYTGSDFEGAPVDPVNLVFVGEADPAAIRAALLALDGSRPGLPPVFPFTEPWSEAIGDVQTGYAEPGGWTGSVIQLQLGAYDPVRFHLRLFRAGELPDGRVVTLGAAHFELLIPKTSEHQVLSWELAEQMVAYDIARTGLLAAPPAPTAVINRAPAWREIPDVIYNELPDELVFLVGGPATPVSVAVPIPSDGRGTVLVLGGSAGIPAGTLTQNLSIVFDQVVPKPFCADGPFDWVLVTGTVDFTREGTVDASGQYAYAAGYEGVLLATPVDITRTPPIPVGEPFTARVRGSQEGFTWGNALRVQARDVRLAPQDGGMEFLNTLLRVSSEGANASRKNTKCLEP